MNSERLLSHFDRISEAPDAMVSVRRFILDLAVRGKLVSQDPEDEPASSLITKIKLEKARLPKPRNVEMQQPLPDAAESVSLFDLPIGWSWVRLGDISRLITSGSRDWAKFYSKDGAIFVRMGNLSRGSYHLRLDNIQRVRPPADREGARTKLEEGDILISITGEVGLLGLIPPGFGESYINQHTCLVRPMGQLKSRYLPELFRSPFARGQFEEPQRGIKNSFRLTDISQFLVPLPPLAEQHRIVAKVDEFMALCDRLEAAQRERESRRDRLAAACLHHLNDGANAEAICEQARFYLNHLPRLTTRAEHIGQLRQAILSLAVRGQLVPQDPKDGTAAELLEQIGARRSEAQPFSIPSSWSWLAVGQIGVARLGKMLDKAKNKGTPRRYIRNVNVRWFDFDLEDVLEMRFEDAELDEFELRRGDVLICEGGEPGRAAVWDERERGIYFQKAIHRVRFPVGVVPHYFANVVRQSADSGRLAAYFTGVGIQHLTGRGLSSFIFPLPPLAEQRRIVAKIEELMSICDLLEVHIRAGQDERRRLLEAYLHEAGGLTMIKPLITAPDSANLRE